jgi:hypothetical protein
VRRTTNRFTLGLALMTALLSPGVSLAAGPRSDAALATATHGPWTEGVSEQDQQTADRLFQEGNTLLEDSIIVKAIEKYTQALKHWNHPAIHYNLALALMNLNQPTELYEHLVAATHYGPEPLDAEKFKYALNYKTLLDGQLTRLELTCDTPGATVSLDGQILFVAPGRFEKLVQPGMHNIAAIKPGYELTDASRTLKPGERVKLDLKLYTGEQLTRYRQRWSAWMPWAVVGSGLAVAAGGGLLHLQTRRDYDAYDVGIVGCGGCVPEQGLAGTRTRGDLLQSTAFGAYALGGAALAAGSVLLYLNRPQPYRIKPEEHEETVNVTPLVGDTNGFLATFRF